MHLVCPRCGIDLELLEPLDRDETIHRPCPTCLPHVEARPTRFVFISPDRPRLVQELVEEYRNDPTIRVLLDRRQHDRRGAADRRQTSRAKTRERRSAERQRKAQIGSVVRGRPER